MGEAAAGDWKAGEPPMGVPPGEAGGKLLGRRPRAPIGVPGENGEAGEASSGVPPAPATPRAWKPMGTWTSGPMARIRRGAGGGVRTTPGGRATAGKGLAGAGMPPGCCCAAR